MGIAPRCVYIKQAGEAPLQQPPVNDLICTIISFDPLNTSRSSFQTPPWAGSGDQSPRLLSYLDYFGLDQTGPADSSPPELCLHHVALRTGGSSLHVTTSRVWVCSSLTSINVFLHHIQFNYFSCKYLKCGFSCSY